MQNIPLKVLIINEGIAPVQAISAVRWTKLAKYLSLEEGCEVTVLTNEKCFDGSSMTIKNSAKDPSTEQDLQFFDVRYIPRTGFQYLANFIFNSGRWTLRKIRDRAKRRPHQNGGQPTHGGNRVESAAPSLAHIVQHGLSSLFNTVAVVLCEWSDVLSGEACWRAGLKTCIDWDSFDVVISSDGPVWPHKLARRVKSLHPGIKWIADFRDPIVRSSRTDTQHNRTMASRLTDGADAIISVSNGTYKNLYLDDCKPHIVLTNGFDPSERSSNGKRQTVFRLTYTGSLYSDSECRQDLSPLFQAVQDLIREGTVDGGKIEIAYAGASGHLFAPVADCYPLVRSVNHGLLVRDKAFELQAESSLLVVCTWNTLYQKGVLTGKVFEYMNRDAPILGLCAGSVPNSELKELIETCHLGFCYEEAAPQSFEQLKSFVRNAYAKWERTSTVKRDARASVEVNRFSYSSLAHDLRSMLDKLVEKAP